MKINQKIHSVAKEESHPDLHDDTLTVMGTWAEPARDPAATTCPVLPVGAAVREVTPGWLIREEVLPAGMPAGRTHHDFRQHWRLPARVRHISPGLTSRVVSGDSPEQSSDGLASLATARLAGELRAHEQRLRARPTPEEQARQEEADRIISEARWFALAFPGSAGLCVLIYAVL